MHITATAAAATVLFGDDGGRSELRSLPRILWPRFVSVWMVAGEQFIPEFHVGVGAGFSRLLCVK